MPTHAQSGRSLVELMVAMALSLVLLAAALVITLAGGRSVRHQDALARLDEHGALALDLLAAQLRMAGYARPVRQGPLGSASGHYSGAGVRGCDHGFVSVTVADGDALSCLPGPSGAAALAVEYEADTANTWPGSAGQPTDCAGNQIAARTLASGASQVLADNRFFIRLNPQTGQLTLYCAGSGGTGFAAQPLIDNVEHLQVRWGIGEEGRRGVARHVDATSFDAEYAHDPARWTRVLSAHVCVVLATPEGMADEPSAHLDCDGRAVWPTDAAQRRIRRSYVTTVQLRNHGGSP
ncbi:MAG: PilW family protein [Burkholderiaceae bacterium]|nr:PilW family protein [Burkholderiaceae bacterium]